MSFRSRKQGPGHLCVVTCDDPSLTARLGPALGSGPGEATVVRLPAGGGALSVELLQRCVAKAVLVDGCDEVLVLTHSTCSLGAVSASALVEAMSKHRIPRSAVPGDLRELVGAGRSPMDAALDAAAALRACAFLPAQMPVHLGRLDDATGQLTIVERGEEHRQARSLEMVANVAGYQPGPMPAHEPGAPMPELAAAMSASLDLPPLDLKVPDAMQAAPGPAPMVITAPVPAGMAIPDAILVEPVPAQRPPPRAQPGRSTKPQRPPAKAQLAQGQALTDAVGKLREFIRGEVIPVERRELREELAQAVASGAGTEELVKITLAPFLKAGQNRYRVIDEMILVKEKAMAMGPDQAAALLRSIIS